MTQPIPNYPHPPPPGLNEAVEATGIILHNEGGVWKASDPDAAAAIAETYDPTTFVKAQKAAELADERWRVETGGFLFQPAGADRPYLFHSTREAMGPVLGAMMAVQAGVFPDPTMWKTAEGVFIPITAADVIELFKAFAAHVAAAFSEEANKKTQVDQSTWENTNSIHIL